MRQTGLVSRLCFRLVRVLPGGEVLVQFGFALKNRDAGKRLDNGEDFRNLGLHSYEGSLAATRFNGFPCAGENAKTGAAHEAQAGQVEDKVANFHRENRRQLPFQFRGGRGIQAAVEFDDRGGRFWRADALCELNFKGHMFFCFRFPVSCSKIHSALLPAWIFRVRLRMFSPPAR